MTRWNRFLAGTSIFLPFCGALQLPEVFQLGVRKPCGSGKALKTLTHPKESVRIRAELVAGSDSIQSG